VADGDHDDDEQRVFQLTEQSPIAHTVAPITMLVAARGSAVWMLSASVGSQAHAVLRRWPDTEAFDEMSSTVKIDPPPASFDFGEISPARPALLS